MQKKDRILTVLFILAWGTNFTVTKVGIDNVPPMLLASLRFILVAFPAILFLRPPKMALSHFIAYGLTIGVGQFVCLYYAIYIGMPVGLTSVVIQSSSFISVLLAALAFRERLRPHQIAGLTIAVSGLFLIGVTAGMGSAAIPPAGVILTVMAASFWSISTIVVKKASMRAEATGVPLNMISLVAWSALIPPIPMALLSFTMDPPKAVWEACRSLSATTILAIMFLAWCSTLFGAGAWNHLLSKYDTGRVAPLSLLVPVVGLLVARIALNERLTTVQWAGSVVIIAGLVIFNLGFQPIRQFKAQFHQTGE